MYLAQPGKPPPAPVPQNRLQGGDATDRYGTQCADTVSERFSPTRVCIFQVKFCTLIGILTGALAPKRAENSELGNSSEKVGPNLPMIAPRTPDPEMCIYATWILGGPTCVTRLQMEDSGVASLLLPLDSACLAGLVSASPWGIPDASCM